MTKQKDYIDFINQMPKLENDVREAMVKQVKDKNIYILFYLNAKMK